MTYSDIKDVVLFALAIYAALLSTFNLYQSVSKDRRKIKVTMMTLAPTYGPHVGPPHVQLHAINSGHRPVTIKSLVLRAPDGKGLFSLSGSGIPGLPDSVLPASLGQGDEATRIYSYRDVAVAMISKGYKRFAKIFPECEDSLGAKYRGDPWTVDLQEWATMT